MGVPRVLERTRDPDPALGRDRVCTAITQSSARPNPRRVLPRLLRALLPSTLPLFFLPPAPSFSPHPFPPSLSPLSFLPSFSPRSFPHHLPTALFPHPTDKKRGHQELPGRRGEQPRWETSHHVPVSRAGGQPGEPPPAPPPFAPVPPPVLPRGSAPGARQ